MTTPIVTAGTAPDYGGISPADEADVIRRLEREGHVILTDSRAKYVSNHYMVGCGVGHSDAEFAESGRSMAAHYENGAMWNGLRWYDDEGEIFSVGVHYYGMRRTRPDNHYCGRPTDASDAIRVRGPMSRTAKWEHRTDGWHIGHRIERTARPAGRTAEIVQAELDADADSEDD